MKNALPYTDSLPLASSFQVYEMLAAQLFASRRPGPRAILWTLIRRRRLLNSGALSIRAAALSADKAGGVQLLSNIHVNATKILIFVLAAGIEKLNLCNLSSPLGAYRAPNLERDVFGRRQPSFNKHDEAHVTFRPGA